MRMPTLVATAPREEEQRLELSEPKNIGRAQRAEGKGMATAISARASQ